ncbi:hypothetical protein PBI_SCTP2_180 [Salicola phage SCTP-2]|nr:hypothetical protein PBI_SCTP2_180 [Salicola phage SCTP-2]
MSSLSNLNPEQKRKLDNLITYGVQVKEEIKLKNESLNEAIKAQADELGVKPKVIRKAITVASKMNFQDEQEEFENVETILDETGRKL